MQTASPQRSERWTRVDTPHFTISTDLVRLGQPAAALRHTNLALGRSTVAPERSSLHIEALVSKQRCDEALVLSIYADDLRPAAICKIEDGGERGCAELVQATRQSAKASCTSAASAAR